MLVWRTVLVVLAGVLAGTPSLADEPADPGKTRFEKSVGPLLISKCVECHSGSDAKSGLDLTQREKILSGGESGTALVPQKPDQSLLWQRIAADEMPPKHPLTAAEKLIVKEWIEGGAVWSGGALDPLKISTEHRAGFDWWSLQPLIRTTAPAVQDAARVRQPIDAFVQAQLQSRGLSAAGPSERQVLIRRLTFDLIGLPPTPEEVAEFSGDDRPDALERLVDRLLASPHYGERWARHWLDVVRFGESNGFERDLPRPNAWPYRDWVIQALNRDLPYDDFVRWQLAGDVLAPGDYQAMQAIGFLVAGAHDTVVPVVDRMRAAMRQDELEDTIGVVGQTFLGLTLNCARCHDHKFDPITAREYYQVAAALSGVDHGELEFTSPEKSRQLAAWQSRIDELTRVLQEQEKPIREKILAERNRPDGADPNRAASAVAPVPIASWDFTRDAKDQVGRMHVQLVGSAKLERDGLVVDGRSYGKSAPLDKDLVEKTLQVRVRLQTLQQAGGGAISLQTIDGHIFDAIVYAEIEGQRWMPGSNGFVRTLSYVGTAEEEAEKQFVTITQVHRADGTIVGYRNGQPYGKPIRKDQAIRFESGKSHVVFGLRHGTEAGGNRMLNAVIAAGRLYDRALTPEEVAAASDCSGFFITEADIAARLSTAEKTTRSAQQTELTDLRLKHAQSAKSAPIKIYSAVATQPPPMKIHKRGSVTMLGDEVAPAGLAAVQGLDSSFGLKPDAIESYRRKKLAEWITDERNPLFARVMANRIWHYHMGSGLVETPSDLGFNGGKPSHPELLEWLAAEFSGRTADPSRFSIKRLHRLIVTSATFRQSSEFNEAAAKVDAGNRMLWRMNPRRLEAESVRDAILSVSGQLNTEIGGKGYTDVNSYFFKGTQFYDPIDPPGFVNQRRTVYRMWARGGRSPFLDTFDCPDPSTTTPRRTATVTPLQALSLLNHSFTLRMADHFANRLKAEAGDRAADQVQLAYRLLYGRSASPDEVTFSSGFVARRGLPAFCRAMWNSSEFLFVD